MTSALFFFLSHLFCCNGYISLLESLKLTGNFHLAKFTAFLSDRGVKQGAADVEADRARETQNVSFGSLSKHPRQSLSLPSNCEGATPSNIVEHKLAAVAL